MTTRETDGHARLEIPSQDERCAGPGGVVFWVAQIIGIPTARAENVLAIKDTSAGPGDSMVKIAIDLTVDPGLSLLRFDVGVAPSLCGAIANRSGAATIEGIVIGGNEGAATGKDMVVRRTGHPGR